MLSHTSDSRTQPGATRLGLGVPAAALLLYLFFLLQAREHAVEVVLLDTHLGGQLGDRDAGLSLHERQRLGRARAAAFAPSGFAARLRVRRRCCRCRFRVAASALLWFWFSSCGGRPGPRRPWVVRGRFARCPLGAARRWLWRGAAADPPTPSSAARPPPGAGTPPPAASAPLSRPVISWRFSSRKSVTVPSYSLGLRDVHHNHLLFIPFSLASAIYLTRFTG